MKQFFLLLSLLSTLVTCLSTFKPARPPAIPLANRNPYLNTYLQAGSDGGNGGYLAGEWPTFWYGNITGWTGMIRVDGANYIWMGDPAINSPLVTQVSYEYTATRSIFTMNVGTKVQMVIEFLSPVTPSDMMRASFPVSYLSVTMSSLDGQSHSVQLYSDISAEWISGDRVAIAQWNYGVVRNSSSKRDVEELPLAEREKTHYTTYGTQTSYTGFTASVTHPVDTVTPNITPHVYPAVPQTTAPIRAAPPNPRPGGVAYHQVFRQTQLLFSEIQQQTEYGNWYYATANTVNLTHQSGIDQNVRAQFVNNGYLANTKDTNYRPISTMFPVFGFSRDFGSISSASPQTMRFTMNLAQDPVIRFLGASGNVSLPGLWKSYYTTDLAAVSFFYNDYATVSGLTTTLDNMIVSDSIAAAGQNYATATTLAVRQAFGALQFAGTPTTPYLFLKEISSDGNVQTVDVIFPFHPIVMYLNPSLLKLMLDPLFINQESGYWMYGFAIHDIGSHYPNATGHSNPQDAKNTEKQPLEECGNMIIMTLAYAQRTGDNAYLSKHYDILRQWNNYLIKEALIPKNQISTDDFAGALANQTNLALKGIIGIQAMSQIASRVGNTADAQNFSSIAHSYISQWQNLGIAKNASPPHSTLAYHMNATYSLLYNLYADRELGLGLVPQSVYDMQSTFYPTVSATYGVRLDTRHNYTKADWQMFCAAIASNSTRDMFTQKLATWINQTPTNVGFTDLYDALSGNFPGIIFNNRPVVGGMFSILALKGAPT